MSTGPPEWHHVRMTRTSEGGSALVELVRTQGPDLHRLAAMLTADTWDATDLVARVVARAGSSAAVPHSRTALQAALVRAYLRSRPRRSDGFHTPDEDAGDVLRRLGPRARAASALRLVEGWSATETASVLHVPTRRAEALVPRTPGLDLALTGLADQHALAGPALEDAVLAAVAEAPPVVPPGPGRRWGRVAAVVLPVALLAGYAVDRSGPEPAAVTTEASEEQAVVQDLTEAGWELTDDGEPPRGPMGLRLVDTATLDDGRRTRKITTPTVGDLSYAAFGVLWCDMPPAEDAHLRVPAGTITVGEDRVELPCAGRDGSPPVSGVVPLPPGRAATLDITGDVPGDGGAVLGLYVEMDYLSTPVPRGERTDAPAVAEGAVALDLGTARDTIYGTRSVQALSVTRDSEIHVWAGRTGWVQVTVDGTPATDDGDYAAMTAMVERWSSGQSPGAEVPPSSEETERAHWSAQQADVREGRWAVHAPGQTRTFSLPADVVPRPGERETVVVQVTTADDAGTRDDAGHLQVWVTDAEPVEVDTAPAAAVPDPDAPELVLGHRLVGQWHVPSDGHFRDLSVDGRTSFPAAATLLAARPGAGQSWFGWDGGLLARGSYEEPLWVEQDLDTAIAGLGWTWNRPPLTGTDPLSVALPPAPGQPPTTVLVYEPVPYEEFDFAAAATPPGLTGPGGPVRDGWASGLLLQADLRPADLERGRVTVPLGDSAVVSARVTTQGRGRIRFLVNRQPADALAGGDGWWSSWTDERVTSQVDLTYGDYPLRDARLTVVVEDYEDIRIEVLTG